jgi:hypothetical protein
MIKIVKRFTAKATQLLITVRQPTDGKPYWSGKRGAQAAAKVAGVIVLPGAGMPFKTDLWIGKDGKLVLGGQVCKTCHKRVVDGIRCPSCGGPLTGIHFKLSDKEKEDVKALGTIESGDFPFAVAGVSLPGAGGGIFAGNIESGDDPFYGVPDEMLEVARLLHEKGRDLLSVDNPSREQLLIIPQVMNAQVATDLEQAKTNAGVEIAL